MNWWTSHLFLEIGHERNNVYYENWQILPPYFCYCFVSFSFPRKPIVKHLTIPHHQKSAVRSDVCTCYIIEARNARKEQLLSECRCGPSTTPSAECGRSGSSALQTALATLNTNRESWFSTDSGVHGVHGVFLWCRVRREDQKDNVVAQLLAFPANLLDLLFSFHQPALYPLQFSYVNLSCWMKLCVIISPD